MLIAETKLKKRIDLMKLTHNEIEEKRQEEWYCPACGSPVIIKNGSVTRAHFAHKCRKICDSFSENESQEHLLGKEIIARNCEKYGVRYELEAYLPDLKQRPDVLIDKEIAIEFQCSPLSVERLRERSEAYLANGYQVIWLLGNKFHMSQKLSNLQKQFIYYSVHLGFHLFQLNVTSEELELVYFISKLPSKYVFKKATYSLLKNAFLRIIRKGLKEEKVGKITTGSMNNYFEQQVKWNYELNRKQSKAMMLQNYFYCKGVSIRALSIWYFFPSFLTPLLMEEEYILRSLVHEYLFCFKKGSLEDILTYVKKKYHFPRFILVSEDSLLHYCLSLYLCFLKEEKVIYVDQREYHFINNSLETESIKCEILWLPLKYVMISK